MTHHFMFKTDAGDVVDFTVMPEAISSLSPTYRSAILWNMDRQMEMEMPPIKPEHVPRYHAWTTEVLACAMSKVKRRLYVKAKK